MTGTVVNFDSVRGFGFIAPDAGGVNVFVHRTELLVPGDERERVVYEGQRVTFGVRQGNRGLLATEVCPC